MYLIERGKDSRRDAEKKIEALRGSDLGEAATISLLCGDQSVCKSEWPSAGQCFSASLLLLRVSA
jgi:hypothetical protein